MDSFQQRPARAISHDEQARAVLTAKGPLLLIALGGRFGVKPLEHQLHVENARVKEARRFDAQ